MRLNWGIQTDRYFEYGLDRAVLYLSDGKAVPWFGMTGIEEAGAASAATYVLDGRPLLYLPQPSEYTATIKAYTYPDEFTETMGIAQATDGMYLDSQIGDSFHLSYRTKIGNGVDSDLGYKIHLVYNATVSPQSKSYAVLSSSINPAEFSWDIQAVPVRVQNYRPTAHVVVDTRHMDADKLTELEDKLYGTDSTSAYIPPAQDVFDAINYGDSIIIRDNGDGTWTAEGSNKNVFMVGNGVFEIDNVNATIRDDGTFDISSTNVPNP